MKKRHGWPRVLAEYWLVRGLATLLWVLPLTLAVRVGGALTWLLSALDRRHRRMACEAVRDRLACDASQADRIVRAMYRHIGVMLAEFPRQIDITPENVDVYVDWGDIATLLDPLFAEGRGIIFATGHIGNWEFTGQAYTQKGYLHGSIARPLDNPKLDAWIKTIRESRGQPIWDKFGAMKQAMRALRNGKAFGILVDQNGGDGGADSMFFGMRCSTMPAPADLALRTGAPIVPAALLRVGPMRFRAVWRPAIRVNRDADPDLERARIIQAYNDGLESIIREAPEQWLWMHRRWRPRKDWICEAKSGQSVDHTDQTDSSEDTP